MNENVILSKRCTKCKIEKNIGEFYTQGKNKDGSFRYSSRCKKCVRKEKVDLYRIEKASIVNIDRSRKGFVELSVLANEIGFELIGEYVNLKEKITFRCIDNSDVELFMTPSNFKGCTYKSIKEFLNRLQLNGDKFIKWTRFINNKGLVALIKTWDGVEVEINASRYGMFIKSRQELYNEAESRNYKILSGYKSSTEKVLVRCGNKNHKPYMALPTNFKRNCECKMCWAEKYSGENHPMYGRVGELNPNYNSNKTDEERECDRSYLKYKQWRTSIYERDNYTCVCCRSKKSGKLNAHHLDGYNWCKEKRTDVDNGVTLCENCHEEFHKIYGKGNNTKEQFEEFMNFIYRQAS